MTDATNDSPAEGKKPDVSIDDQLGCANAKFPPVVARDEFDGKIDVQTTGFWYDDEPPSVELQFGDGRVYLTPARARKLARRLSAAADRAEEGDKELVV